MNEIKIELSIIDSDKFLSLSPMAQALYFHLVARSDENGFIYNPKSILRATISNVDTLDLLIVEGFVKTLNDGISIIRENPFLKKGL